MRTLPIALAYGNNTYGQIRKLGKFKGTLSQSSEREVLIPPAKAFPIKIVITKSKYKF